MNEINLGNISNKNDFRIECQYCKCKKVELVKEEYLNRWDSDDIYLRCCHCGKKKHIYSIYK